MNCVYLRDELAAALDTVWDDVNRFWELVYIFSDDVQDRCEVAADGFRWLCAIRQRPWSTKYHPEAWWCYLTPGYIEFNQLWVRDPMANYLPTCLYGAPTEGDIITVKRADRVVLLEKAVTRWFGASSLARTRLWKAARSLTVKQDAR